MQCPKAQVGRAAAPSAASSQAVLTTSLCFRQHELETAYTAESGSKNLVVDKISILAYLTFPNFWKHEALRPYVVLVCLLQCGKAWLLWRHPAWWLRNRTVLLLAWKCLRAWLQPAFIPFIRNDAVSWATFARLILMPANVGLGMLSTCAHVTTFLPDTIVQFFVIRSAMLVVTNSQSAEGGFCGKGSEHLLGQVYSSLQQWSCSLLAPVLGRAVLFLGTGSHTNPCVVVVLFIQVFVLGVLWLPLAYVLERRSRLSWWQRHTGRRLPPGEVSWRILALRTFVLLGLTAALLFSAIDALVPAL